MNKDRTDPPHEGEKGSLVEPDISGERTDRSSRDLNDCVPYEDLKTVQSDMSRLLHKLLDVCISNTFGRKPPGTN